MASTPPKSDPRDDAFLREVDEEYRRDQVNSLVKRYGRWVALAVALGLLALGGFLYWRSEQARARAEAGEAYLGAIDRLGNGGSTEALAALRPMGQGRDAGYRALSLLAQAAVAARAGDTARAAGLYRAVADDAALDPPFRDLARIKGVRLEYDALPPAQVIARLAAFTRPGNPWYGVAGEMTALARLKAGQRAQAAALFLALAGDRGVAETIRARAEQMAATLGQDTSALGTAAPATAPTAPTTKS